MEREDVSCRLRLPCRRSPRRSRCSPGPAALRPAATFKAALDQRRRPLQRQGLQPEPAHRPEDGPGQARRARPARSSRTPQATTSRTSRRSRGRATTQSSARASCSQTRRRRSRRSSRTPSSRSRTTPCRGPPFSDKKGKLLVKNITGMTYASPSSRATWSAASPRLMAKKGGGNTISATGGVKIPPVDSFIAGYKAGAAKCAPGTKVLVGYSQDFIAQDKCKAVAQNQIAAGPRSSSRSPARAASARSRRRRRPASGATASTSTSRTSARTS